MSKKYTYATTLVNGGGIPKSNDDTERFTPVEPPGRGWEMCGSTVIPCGALLWFWRREVPHGDPEDTSGTPCPTCRTLGRSYAEQCDCMSHGESK